MIAAVIGCSTVTLRTRFADELEFGAARRRAEIITLLYRVARRGNVSALRRLIEMMRAAEAAQRPAKPPRLGKKENCDEPRKKSAVSWAAF
jgi:hypothetical protein